MLSLLKSKDEVLHYIKLYEAMVSARFSQNICNFRCDNGGTFVNQGVRDFFAEKGIQYELTFSRVPEQNGVDESMNQSILDKAQCTFLGSNLGKTFWLKAALTAVYLINRSPNSALPEGKLPAELWYCRKPDLTQLRVFGCLAYAHKVKCERSSKLDSHSRKCFMLGYCDNGYRLWCTDLKIVIVASSVKLDKRYWDHEWQETSQTKSLEESREDTDSGGEQESFRGFEELPVDEEYKGCRVKKAPEYIKDYVVSGLKKGSRGKVVKEGDSLAVVLMVDDVNLSMSATSFYEGLPMNVEELRDRTDKNNWFKAIDEEPNYDVTKECIVNAKHHRELVGSLMYACLTTRPDICAAVNFYSQFQTDANEMQCVGLNRVLRYLKGTLDLGLWIKGISDGPLLGHADADFANRSERKSVTGYIFEMYGDAVCWQLTSNKTVALSSTESEFVALASATVELLWLMQLFTYLGIELCNPINCV
ncbi:hypothetical protein PR048_020948 [Dryococelus australis]|uniref:Integrase catalytic domain-containing protein n=1 Tax=Dryococelus australis TaxID=614101 RepID=A0ABQ9GWW8_9NEOP|nr:hypothetical protein PR048_020948 [Dryococelus australis]